MLLAGLLFWLGICWLIGTVVNKLAGRPLMNWLAWYGYSYLFSLGALILVSMFSNVPNAAYLIGQYLVLFGLPGCIGVYLSVGWRKKNPSKKSEWEL